MGKPGFSFISASSRICLLSCPAVVCYALWREICWSPWKCIYDSVVRVARDCRSSFGSYALLRSDCMILEDLSPLTRPDRELSCSMTSPKLWHSGARHGMSHSSLELVGTPLSFHMLGVLCSIVLVPSMVNKPSKN